MRNSTSTIALDAALAGRPARPALEDLDEPERRVLLKTFDTPRGQVRTYAWVAAELGRPREAREVGAVLAENPLPLPLLVSCHRVVRSDGQLGWYNCGGSAAKRALLAHEGVDVDRIGELVRR